MALIKKIMCFGILGALLAPPALGGGNRKFYKNERAAARDAKVDHFRTEDAAPGESYRPRQRPNTSLDGAIARSLAWLQDGLSQKMSLVLAIDLLRMDMMRTVIGRPRSARGFFVRYEDLVPAGIIIGYATWALREYWLVEDAVGDAPDVSELSRNQRRELKEDRDWMNINDEDVTALLEPYDSASDNDD